MTGVSEVSERCVTSTVKPLKKPMTTKNLPKTFGDRIVILLFDIQA